MSNAISIKEAAITQGKIERWHRTMKDKILLDHYYMPEDLENKVSNFIKNYNTWGYHESLNDLTPEDIWRGRRQSILEHRCKTKEKTMNLRKQLYSKQKAA